jgi:hypothetical protein
MTTVIRRTNIRLLKVEQLTLDVETASVTAERAARCDHPVARYDDGDWIPVVRHADGTVGMRVANGFRNVAVAPGLAVGNFEQRAPACKLEVGSAEIERKRKLATLAREVVVEFEEIGSEGRSGLTQLSPGIHFHHAVLKFEPHQTFRRSGEEEWTDGRRCTSVEKSFHDALENSTTSDA